MVCEVFVGIPFPPGLQLGSTHTGFHPLSESFTFSRVTFVSSDGACAKDNVENNAARQNAEKTLCMTLMLSTPKWREFERKRSNVKR
jgi:hypothetical protein